MKIFFIGVGALVVLALGATFLIPPSGQSVPSDPDILALGGLHWHPELRIFVKGEEMKIPENVGLGVVHRPVHTHDDLPVVHLEFPAVVRKDDVRLGRFFEIWGRDMRSFGETIRMTVNGVENTEYEEYVMRDGDKIELRYDE